MALIRLRVREDIDDPFIIVPLHPQLHDETHEVLGYTNGKVRKGIEFIWRAHPGGIPDHLVEVVEDPRGAAQVKKDEEVWAEYQEACLEARSKLDRRPGSKVTMPAYPMGRVLSKPGRKKTEKPEPVGAGARPSDGE